MKAGDLKHRITLERPVDTTDARGNRRTVWQPFATCMASMADVSGRDFYAGHRDLRHPLARRAEQRMPHRPYGAEIPN